MCRVQFLLRDLRVFGAETQMEVPIDRHKRFVAVEFPGIVENVDKAMECLGGLDTVNKVKMSFSTNLCVLLKLSMGDNPRN